MPPEYLRREMVKGSHHTKEARRKNSEAHEGKGIGNTYGFIKGQIPWNKGKKGSQQAWNKGREWSEESKQRMSKASEGCYHTEETRKRISKSMKILKNRPEEKRKTREFILDRISKSMQNGEQIAPFYNEKACEWFKEFDEINKTKGQYATDGGELCVLGYWLDYINHEKKLIIEWDEEYHYVNGKLRKKDVIRQKEIEQHFPGYTLIRIREAKEIPQASQLLKVI